MWLFVIVAVVVVLTVTAIAVGGHAPRDADRGGFEQHPGTGGPFSGGPLS